MAKWSGKSKGTVLGYKIFIFFIKNVSVRAAYVVLWFVALYYTLFSSQSGKAIYYYFRKRLGYSKMKAIFSEVLAYSLQQNFRNEDND